MILMYRLLRAPRRKHLPRPETSSKEKAESTLVPLPFSPAAKASKGSLNGMPGCWLQASRAQTSHRQERPDTADGSSSTGMRPNSLVARTDRICAQRRRRPDDLEFSNFRGNGKKRQEKSKLHESKAKGMACPFLFQLSSSSYFFFFFFFFSFAFGNASKNEYYY